MSDGAYDPGPPDGTEGWLKRVLEGEAMTTRDSLEGIEDKIAHILLGADVGYGEARRKLAHKIVKAIMPLLNLAERTAGTVEVCELCEKPPRPDGICARDPKLNDGCGDSWCLGNCPIRSGAKA